MKIRLSRPITTRDLLPSERLFCEAMYRLQFGRFESIRINCGELVLDPWPNTIRQVRFGVSDSGGDKKLSGEFRLTKAAAEFFEYVRSVDIGEIRILEIKSGLPFSMQVHAIGAMFLDG